LLRCKRFSLLLADASSFKKIFYDISASHVSFTSLSSD
jgi:hypothetical protein